MSVCGEVYSTEGHIPEQAGLRPLVETEESQVLDDRPGADLAAASYLTRHLQTDLHYLQGIGEHHLGTSGLGRKIYFSEGKKQSVIFQYPLTWYQHLLGCLLPEKHISGERRASEVTKKKIQYALDTFLSKFLAKLFQKSTEISLV